MLHQIAAMNTTCQLLVQVVCTLAAECELDLPLCQLWYSSEAEPEPNHCFSSWGININTNLNRLSQT